MKQSKNNTQVTPVINVLLKDISVSPFNHGRDGVAITEDSVAELAESIKNHGVIQPITVRSINGDKYEIIIGERRYRASLLAKMTSIPVIVNQLSDEQVMEIQIVENLQRENPHPLSEAKGIAKLLEFKSVKNTPESIALNLGKSIAYVYQRIKLNNLINLIQDMFFANVLNHSQALSLARLDADSQLEFYNQYCLEWLTDPYWSIGNFKNRIENFQLDLGDAPFDIKNAKLDKKAGACTKCIHNTAVTSSLFPDDETDARCTNRPCFVNKCKISVLLLLAQAIKENPDLPIACPSTEELNKFCSANEALLQNKIILIEDVDYYTTIDVPTLPLQEDYNDYDEEEDNIAEYNDALEEYHQDLENYDLKVKDGIYKKAIFVNGEETGNIVYLTAIPEAAESGNSNNYNSATEHKAKDYQEALKSKSLSKQIVEAEIARLRTREERSKEIDKSKLHEAMYNDIQENQAFKEPTHPVGKFDRAVMIFLLLDSLGYHTKKQFLALISTPEERNEDEQFDLTEFCVNATEEQLSLLIKHALVNKTDSKYPNGTAGQMLRLIYANTPGIDENTIINQFNDEVKERINKMEAKLVVLNKQLLELE